MPTAERGKKKFEYSDRRNFINRRVWIFKFQRKKNFSMKLIFFFYKYQDDVAISSALPIQWMKSITSRIISGQPVWTLKRETFFIHSSFFFFFGRRLAPINRQWKRPLTLWPGTRLNYFLIYISFKLWFECNFGRFDFENNSYLVYYSSNSMFYIIR